MIENTSSFDEFVSGFAGSDRFTEIVLRHKLEFDASGIRIRYFQDVEYRKMQIVGIGALLAVGGDLMEVFVGVRSFAMDRSVDHVFGGPSLQKTVFIQQVVESSGLMATRLEFLELDEGTWVAHRFLGTWHGPQWFAEIARPIIGDPPDEFETPVADVEAVLDGIIGAMVAKAKETAAAG
jgi:hypothetical protein